jgi:DNA adenine methylase Dam
VNNIASIGNRRYLGSKAKLLSFIDEVVSSECQDVKSIADIFAGTGNVAYWFSTKKKKVIVNDILLSNKLAYDVWFGSEKIDLSLLADLVNQFNSLEVNDDNYFSDTFSDTFFSRKNARIIGAVREDIENKYNNQSINSRERAYLITALVYAVDRIANTVGHYDAYIRGGNLEKKLTIPLLDIKKPKNNLEHQIYCEDANSLVLKIYADLVYVDPPYNSRQYSDAYHLLENLVRWEKPEVFGVAKKMNRSKLKSKYSMNQAPREFENLIHNISAKYILVSYNNMGTKGAGRSQAKISDVEIMETLSNKGYVKVFEHDFNQFTTGKTNIHDHKERLFLCYVGKRDPNSTIEIQDEEKFVKSPLNYTGGKYKLLPQLMKHFTGFDTFIDLFGGGFNVGSNVQSKNVVYNDKQTQVVRLIKLFELYNTSEILNRINAIIKTYDLSSTIDYGYSQYGCDSNNGVGNFNKEKYYRLRQKYNSSDDSHERDFMLMTLIIYGFNNQIRFNSEGHYNMPVGKRDLNNSVRKNIVEFSNRVKSKNIIFFSEDFENIDTKKYVNSVVYCDPPYYLGIASYNENEGWSINDERRLLRKLSDISNEGQKFALSNVIEHKGLKHQELIDWCLENHYNINYIHSNYNNSNYQSTSKNHLTIEVLVTNY